MRCQSLLSVHHYFLGVYSFCITDILLVFKIVLRTFLLSFDWLVLIGEQFSRPCRCLVIYSCDTCRITQKLEVYCLFKSGLSSLKHNSEVFRPIFMKDFIKSFSHRPAIYKQCCQVTNLSKLKLPDSVPVITCFTRLIPEPTGEGY